MAAVLGAALALALVAATPAAFAQPRRAKASRPDLAGLAVPPGSRPDSKAPGAYRSGRALRPTIEFYKRLLSKRGLEYREIPLYQRRGVLVTRLLASAPGSPWAAIHIWKSGSRTRIAIVPNSGLTPAQ